MADATIVWSPQAPSASAITTTSDSDGIYRVILPFADRYVVTLNGNPGNTVRVQGALFITDFLLNSGGCPLRYGFVIDAVTKQPVVNARVTWAGVQTTSGGDGGYRLNVICRGRGVGTGTSFLQITHPSYIDGGFTGPRLEMLGMYPDDDRQDWALTPR